jgi:hypothetical protein
LNTYFGTVQPDHFEAPCFGSSIDLTTLHFSEAELVTFKGILCIIGSAYPNLEYTPMIPAMVACFLKHMDADHVLGAMAAMIKGHSIPADKKLEWAYFPLNRRDFLVFQRVFENLIQKLNPKIWKHMLKFQLINPDYAPDWENLLSKMFLDIYPLWVVSRMVDAFLVEGYKIVLRFAVAHLQYRKRAIYAAKTKDELNYSIMSPYMEMSKAEGTKLIQMAYNLKFSRTDIWRYRNRNRKLSLEDFDKIDRILMFHRPLPVLLRPSEFVKEDQWCMLWSWIPSRYRLLNLSLVFSTSEHGRSFSTLYEKTENFEPLLILIQTSDEIVLGAFASKSFSLRTRTNFYGTGETFIFRLTPNPISFVWNPNSDSSAFICAADEFIAFGAGPKGFGLLIDNGMQNVHSSPSETFNSASLISDNQWQAVIHTLEIFVFK